MLRNGRRAVRFLRVFPMRHLFAALTLAFLLAACAGGLPSIDDRAKLTQMPVDRQAAQARINGYRAEHGLPPLTLSADLNLVAQDMADHIAGRDKRKSSQHSAEGLLRRLMARGVDHEAAAENLGFGYASFEKAFIGWQGSPGHDKNLLNPNVTEMGIAYTTRSDGMWRNFWALIMVRPKA